MTVRSDSVGEQPRASEDGWYARAPEDVVAAFGVNPAVGLSAARAAELLTAQGPNSLPEEKRTPAWRRFLEQYRSYMQIVLVAAAVVAAFECRSETDSALATSTFDSKQMNWVALAQFVLAVLVTQMDGFRRVLGTTRINARQFGWALLAALALLLLWELGKLLARRSRGT